MRKIIVIPSILLVLMLMVIPMNVAAQQHVLSSEWMTICTPPAWGNTQITDAAAGFTDYGVGWDEVSNFVDLREDYMPDDTVKIEVDISSMHGPIAGRWVHYFVVELYTETDWIDEGNPCDSDDWYYIYQPFETGSKQDTMTIVISANDCENTDRWLVMYQAEAVDIDQTGWGPPYFEVNYQNFWIILKNPP